MRRLTTPAALERFMEALAKIAREPISIYFTGGVTAILHGWRETTIDIDLKLVPDSDAVMRELPRLKESLEINVELAAPDQFIPELPGWQDRSLLIDQRGSVSFFHYDPYSQALSKIERGHTRDQSDVRSMFEDNLVDPELLLELYERIEPGLYRFPAIDPASFRRAVQEAVKMTGS